MKLLTISRMMSVLLSIVALVACDATVSPPRSTVAGQFLPAFSILDHDNQPQVFTPPKTGVLVLNLWAIWCPPCREEMPGLQRLADSHDAANLQVIGLAIEEDAYLLDEYLRKYQISFSVKRMGREQAESILGLREYPLTLLLRPDGRILARLVGAFDWDDPAIRSLLQQLGQRQDIDSEAIDAVFRNNQKAQAAARRQM